MRHPGSRCNRGIILKAFSHVFMSLQLVTLTGVERFKQIAQFPSIKGYCLSEDDSKVVASNDDSIYPQCHG